MDEKKKDILIDLAFTIFFLISFIIVYSIRFANPVPVVSSPMVVNVLGVISTILLFFAVFFFFTLLNQIFSDA